MKWIVMRIQQFEFEINYPIMGFDPISLGPEEKMSGYLPVYDSMEDALADFPNGPLQPIELTESERVS